MDNLITRLTDVNARLKAIPDRLGVPQYGDVAVFHNGVYSVLVPRPKILQVTPRKVNEYLGLGVEIFLDDRELTGIPRSYPLEKIANGRYFLDAVRLPDGTYTGSKCEVIYIDRNGLLEYRVLVRKMRAR